ncbi:ABC transporter permease [Maribellus maritimus]|uniref:ABC transporter permease n=1 Tax=Maribellus maritimus TaxID=2870838 RepID=UPI001EEC775A|nr:ABC transporter permease [Maribellus maritimus]MCG6189782.1 ABC transporter permease [Maribellus maritimus]
MFRNLRENKLHSTINIFGLAIAITLVLLLSSYVSNEISVDSFHLNKDRIYRVHGDNIETFAPPFGQYILENVAEAESYARTFTMDGTLTYDNKKFESGNCLLTDSTFFTIFSFPILVGDTRELLSANEDAVLSESFAKKIFGKKNPVGESIKFNGKDFVVSGIFRDFKDNTHFVKPNMIINFSMLPRIWGMSEENALKYFMKDYGNSSFGLYLLAHKNSNIKVHEKELLEKAKEFYWVFQNDRSNKISFMPLEEVYFNLSARDYIGTRQGNKKFLNILTIIAFSIVIIAAINYINLSITQSVKRAKEVGIKKIIGSLRWGIVRQFLMESTIVSFISTTIAVLLTILVLPEFNRLVNTAFKFSDIFNNGFLFRSLLVVFVTGLIAGFVPSLILSGFKSLEIIKGVPSRLRNSFSQKAMVVFQYTVSIALIVVVAFIMKQNNYMRNYDLGFDKDHTFYIRMTDDTNKQKNAFGNELMKIPGVKAVSFCQDFPGGPINNQSFVYNDKAQSFDQFRVDTAFFSALGIPLKNRISITDNVMGEDKFALIINKTAVNDLELEPPYNEFRLHDNVVKVSEVVEDMNFRSLYQRPHPTMFQLRDMNWAPYVLVRGSGNNLIAVVTQAKAVFKDISPSDPLELNFIDDALNIAYQKEERTAKIVGYFAIFAILISSLGIFALAAYTAQNRRKEIGVRKVNGAQITQIVNLLNINFVKWVIIAFFIATPVAWVATKKWLENFAYKTNITWTIFALAGILALGIALFTVSWQSWKAATKNPVDSLRYE